MRKLQWTSLLVMALFPAVLLAQDTTHYRIRNIAWATPVGKSSVINGLAIGLMASPFGDATIVKINGLNIEAAPISAFFWAYAVAGTVSAPFYKKDTANDRVDYFADKNAFPDDEKDLQTRIRGISLSGGGLVEGSMYGLSVNCLVGMPHRMYGVEVTGFMNMHYKFNGLMIAGLRNKVTKGNGVQIALINTCKSGHVVQFGLINRIGKRTLPFMNASFKR